MCNIMLNEIELNLVYDWIPNAITSYDRARNLAYHLGNSTLNENKFDRALQKMVNDGELIKIYDFVEDGFREGLYEFTNEKAQISFVTLKRAKEKGKEYMNMKLFYDY